MDLLVKDWQYSCYLQVFGSRRCFTWEVAQNNYTAILFLWFLWNCCVYIVLALGFFTADSVHSVINSSTSTLNRASYDFLALPTSSTKIKVGGSGMGHSTVFLWWKQEGSAAKILFSFSAKTCQVWVLLLQLCYHLALQTFLFWRVEGRIDGIARCYWRGYSYLFQVCLEVLSDNVIICCWKPTLRDSLDEEWSLRELCRIFWCFLTRFVDLCCLNLLCDCTWSKTWVLKWQMIPRSTECIRVLPKAWVVLGLESSLLTPVCFSHLPKAHLWREAWCSPSDLSERSWYSFSWRVFFFKAGTSAVIQPWAGLARILCLLLSDQTWRRTRA